MQTDVEGCDDGNTVTEECDYGVASCTVCAADCTEQAGETDVCGDGTVDEGEACDDGNTVTETCDYGLANCTVCAAECTEQPGETNVCGDAVTDPEEECDDGNDSNADNCSTDCTALDLNACIGSCGGQGTEGSVQTFMEPKAIASDGRAGDLFGYSVAISGDLAIVGASSGFSSGSAYILSRNPDGSWSETAKLLASDGAQFDTFGTSVAISGDTAIVGANAADGNADVSGSAYIFSQNSDGSWTENDKLLASDGTEFDAFGTSVAISGDTAIVGAHLDDDDGSSSGSAYIAATRRRVGARQSN